MRGPTLSSRNLRSIYRATRGAPASPRCCPPYVHCRCEASGLAVVGCCAEFEAAARLAQAAVNVCVFRSLYGTVAAA